MSGCQRVFTRLKVQTTQFWCNLETHEWNQIVNLEVAVNYSVISQNHSESHLAFPNYGYFLWCCKLVTHSRYPVNCYSAAVIVCLEPAVRCPWWGNGAVSGLLGSETGEEAEPELLVLSGAIPPARGWPASRNTPLDVSPMRTNAAESRLPLGVSGIFVSRHYHFSNFPR